MPLTISGEGYREFSEPRFFECETIEDVPKIRNPSDKSFAFVMPNDGGSFDTFKFLKDDTTADDGINSLTPTNPGASGRWKRAGESGYAVNVRMFGAKGDDTTDDSAAFQAAIDAVESIGYGDVIIPPGDYRIDTGLTVHGSNIRIRGSGRRTSNIKFYGTGVALALGDAAAAIFRWSVEDIRITDSSGGTATHGALLRYAREGFMQNVEIRGGFTTAGLFLSGAGENGNWSNRFFNLQIVSCTGHGIVISLQSNAVMFYGCMVSSCTQDNVRIQGANGVRFTDCQFENAGSGYEVHVSGITVNAQIYSLAFNNCYWELKPDTVGARAIYVAENGALVNAVEEILVVGGYVWGTEDSAYAFEFNNPNGNCFGKVISPFIHGVTTAGTYTVTANDRIAVEGTRCLSGFGTVPSLPILDNNSETGAGSAVNNVLRGHDFTGQIRLPRFSGTPISVLGEGSIWYATGPGRVIYRDASGGNRHIQPVISGTTGNRPSTPPAGFTYLDTTLGKPIWYDGAGWIDATGASV